MRAHTLTASDILISWERGLYLVTHICDLAYERERTVESLTISGRANEQRSYHTIFADAFEAYPRRFLHRVFIEELCNVSEACDYHE